MHGAAETLAVTGLATHQLGHHAVDASALGDAVTVATMVGSDDVVIAERFADPGGDGLLALVTVRRALDDAFLEQVGSLVLKGPDAAHGDVEVLECLGPDGDVAHRAFVHRLSPPAFAASPGCMVLDSRPARQSRLIAAVSLSPTLPSRDGRCSLIAREMTARNRHAVPKRDRPPR